VARSGNGRIRPDYVLIEGKPQFHKEGAYYIEWYIDGKRYRESVGKNGNEAFAAAKRKSQVLRNQALGLEIVGEDKQTRTTLAGASHEFLEEARQQKRPKTTRNTRRRLDTFVNHVVNALFVRSSERIS
jgi:hypothetical protein